MAEENPLRVLVIVSNKNPAWTQSLEDIIRHAIHVINDRGLYNAKVITTSDTRLLAIQRYSVRKMFVFDIANKNYDPKKGHLPEQNKLPVIVVHLSGRELASKPHPGECQRINDNVRYLHDANGWEGIPPFMEDHTSGIPPNYPNPRSLTLSGHPHKAP